MKSCCNGATWGKRENFEVDVKRSVGYVHRRVRGRIWLLSEDVN
jgi:hypothetical protein